MFAEGIIDNNETFDSH